MIQYWKRRIIAESQLIKKNQRFRKQRFLRIISIHRASKKQLLNDRHFVPVQIACVSLISNLNDTCCVQCIIESKWKVWPRNTIVNDAWGMSIEDGDFCDFCVLMLKQRSTDYLLIFVAAVVFVVPGSFNFSIVPYPACHCRTMECTAKHSYWSCV